MLDKLAVGVGFLLCVTGCGDTVASKDAGNVNSPGSTSGTGVRSDAGGLGGSVNVSGAGGSGASEGGSGAGGSGGGGPGTPASINRTCSLAPDLVPEAGVDRCLGCLVERCCDDALGAAECLLRSECYSSDLATIRECFAREWAGGHNLDDDAGWRDDPWYTVAACADEAMTPIGIDGGTGLYRFPVNSLSFTHMRLLECAVGSRPETVQDDATVGPDGRALMSVWASTRDDDAGMSLEKNTLLFEEQCAEECFAGWR